MAVTHGDHYNSKCPHCGKASHFVPQLARVEVPKEGRLAFTHPCRECRAPVHYVAERSRDKDGFGIILLEASTDPPQQQS